MAPQQDDCISSSMSNKKNRSHSARSGGGGMCPFSSGVRSGRKFSNLDVSELAGLGKASEGIKRELTSVPAGFRLENTGLRIEFISRSISSLLSKQFRGVVYATTTTLDIDNPSNSRKHLRSVDLPKRNEPSWSGLHLHLNDGEFLMVHVQERSCKTNITDHSNITLEEDHYGEDSVNASPWIDSFPPVSIEPLKAFTVQDQDVAWLKTPIGGCPVAPTDTVWAELSLQKKSSNLMAQTKGTNIASRQRKLDKVKIESTARDEDVVKAEQAIFEEVLGVTDDPMTKHDVVYMKDIWNKCLGWIGMTGEHFVESLFLRCPDLLQTFGEIPAELAFDMFVSIIDLTVRNLDPRTEVIGREAYRAMPIGPEVDAPFMTMEEGYTQFAQLGMRPRHWKEARAIFLITMKHVNPYLEDNDLELLSMGRESCVYRFWTHRIMKGALFAIKQLDDVFDSEENMKILSNSFEPFSKDKVRSGVLFYEKLFDTHPEVIPYFGRTDMDFLAGHLFDAVELLSKVFNSFEKATPVLQQLGKIHDLAKIPVFTYGAIGEVLDAVLRELMPSYGDGSEEGENLVRLWSTLVNRTVLITTRISFVSERLLRKAFEWVDQVAYELKWDDAHLSKRHLEIEEEVRMRGTYTHTEEEVVHGARVAWRNTAKCIGRIAWNTLLVRDRRHVTNLDAMFAECLEHQRLATADGSLKSVMTVFKPRQPGTRMGTRFWNLQLVRFACYENENGALMGDRANKAYTDEVIAFGWKPPVPRTEFDVLPIVIEDPIAGITKMFELPKEYHKVTMISHPKFPEFAKLGLRWCVVPTVTSFTMKIGGLEYPCNPFNGWFMETEITRDLLEPGRMDKMELIAQAIGVDSTDEDDFWRERVGIETNKAVMASFRRDGHSVVDHVTAQGQFLAHDAREKREGRECPAQWSWVVPSFGGSTMPIWHHEMRDFYLEPSYDYQAEIYAVRKESRANEEELLASEEVDDSFEKLLILFASVTGTAEGYAYRAKKMLRPLQVDVASCESYKATNLWSECLQGGGKYSAVLFITSTFGEGSPPPSAEDFFTTVSSLPLSALASVPFAVLALGSTVYPDYCKAGFDLNKALSRAGGKQLLPLSKADQLNGQEDTVLRWISAIGAVFSIEQKKALIASGDFEAIEEPDPVTVELLKDDDERVVAALSDEERLVPSDPAGSTARFLRTGYKLCHVTKNDELVDFSTPESKELFRSTRFLEFDLNGISQNQSESDLTYESGDHARILPVNDKSIVLEMCQQLGLKPIQWAQVTINEGKALPTSVMRIGDLLSLEIDLATQQDDANLPLLQHLLDIAQHSEYGSMEAKAELARLDLMVENLRDASHLSTIKAGKLKAASEEAATMTSSLHVQVGGVGGIEIQEPARDVVDNKIKHGRLRSGSLSSHGSASECKVEAPSAALVREDGKKRAVAKIVEFYVTIPELLAQFPITASKLTLADCIETLPRLAPRHYSIASSSEMHTNKVQLSVGKLTITHKSTNRQRKGVCSHFLADTIPKGSGSSNATDEIVCATTKSYVRLGISQSTFRLPGSLEMPLIMVGPGTGISPMLAFLQAREQALSGGSTLGPCMVFFGCRAQNDFLHSAQMQKWVDMGVISDLKIAFSRLPGQPKQYVQDIIAQHRDAVWQMLQLSDCHYYVCGDSNMAEDVMDELKAAARDVGGLDHHDAAQYFNKMKKERRVQADTWGVVVKREENLKKTVEKKYNQGGAWLKHFKKNKSLQAQMASLREIQARSSIMPGEGYDEFLKFLNEVPI